MMRNLRSGKYNLVLSWFNTLGGIDTMNFYAEPTYGLNISSGEIAENDVYNNWDSNFANGVFDHELVNINANERVTVRTQRLNRNQAISVGDIKISPQVVDIIRGVQVKIDRSSWNFWNEGDKSAELSFVIEYPKIVVPIV